MSLLGFDALGRLALGQLSRIGHTNTVMPAGSISYSVVPISALFAPRQSSATGAFVLTGNGASMRAFLAGVASGFAVTGNAGAFAAGCAVGAGGFFVTGNSATCTANLLSFSGAYTLNGNAAVFGATSKAGRGSYSIASYPINISRDFEAWFPRPFGEKDWVVDPVEPAMWTGSTSPAESWSVQNSPAGTWTPSVEQPKIWIAE